MGSDGGASILDGSGDSQTEQPPGTPGIQSVRRFRVEPEALYDVGVDPAIDRDGVVLAFMVKVDGHPRRPFFHAHAQAVGIATPSVATVKGTVDPALSGRIELEAVLRWLVCRIEAGLAGSAGSWCVIRHRTGDPFEPIVSPMFSKSPMA